MKRLWILAFAVQFAFLAVATSRAQAPAPNAAPTSPIASIKATGSKKFPSDQIVTASGLKAGDVVTAQQIQDATNRLAGLGIFSSVNFRYTTAASAINLEFQLTDAPTYPIVFDNMPWFTSDEIGDAIRKKVGLFTGEAPDGGAMLDAMTDVVEDLLESKGVKGEVTHQPISAPVDDGMVMQFHVDAPNLRVQSIQFGDPLAADSEKLKDRVSDLKGQPYSLFAVELFDIEQVRPIYAEKGFLRAKIGPPQAHFVPDMYDPKLSAVELSIPIAPGAVYSLNKVTLQDYRYVDSDTLRALLDVKPGDVADGMKLEAQWQKIESYYGQHGYLDMKLKAVPQFDDAAHQVSYVVNISEGSQYHMGEMVITGLSVEAEKRLRQAWQLEPGQVFDDGYYELHMKMLSKPSREIFGNLPVHYNEFGHFLRPNTASHTVDVLMDFK
jgi:outer membrane protein insertion porin family